MALPASSGLTGAFGDFESAAGAVLEYLRSVLPFDLWMVTRTTGADWIVIQALDHGYDVKAGDAFRWSDSFCSRMVEGEGPRMAPAAGAVPAYAAAPIGEQVPIGAYVGVPLSSPDGSLLGTLCAIDPTPQPVEIELELPVVELLGGLLSTVLHHELGREEAARRAERAELEAQTDPLTGIANRRAWERTIEIEEARCRRYGSPASVLSIDLDGLKATNDSLGHAAGDDLLRRACQAVRRSLRKSDFFARLGGDEFAVLAVETDPTGAAVLAQSLRQSLRREGISASVGVGNGVPRQGLSDALREADVAMYRAKEARKG